MRARPALSASFRLSFDPERFDTVRHAADDAQAAGVAERRTARSRTHAARGELAGTVRIRHAGRNYCGWYRLSGGLLTVHCGLASNTGLLPSLLPSPTPLAERLLRDLVDAEHPGLNPE